MAQLEIVYIGKFGLKDLDSISRSKYLNNMLSFDEISKDNLNKDSKKLYDRCEYAVFKDGKNKIIIKHIKLI